MKKLFATILILLCATISVAQNRVGLSSREHNFGKIEETAGDASCEFVVKNTSSEPLVISSVRTNCSCITTHFSRKPIAPQRVDTIRVRFDPRFREGAFNKNISVYISGDSLPTILTIRGDVIGR